MDLYRIRYRLGAATAPGTARTAGTAGRPTAHRAATALGQIVVDMLIIEAAGAVAAIAATFNIPNDIVPLNTGPPLSAALQVAPLTVTSGWQSPAAQVAAGAKSTISTCAQL